MAIAGLRGCHDVTNGMISADKTEPRSWDKPGTKKVEFYLGDMIIR